MVDGPILSVRDLRIDIKVGRRLVPVVDAANFDLGATEIVGLVGESGSGKTMMCRALVGTLKRRGAVLRTGSSIRVEGRELAGAPERVWRQVRGKEIGYVPQSSLAGLNPVLTVQTQLVESLAVVSDVRGKAAELEALELLDLVRIPRARDVLHERSHQLSGGMRQRVMIAAALAQKPRILVADEPTTALDVTVQREILDLLKRLRHDIGMALLVVSHDLAIIEELCDSVVVMYAGATVETGSVDAVARRPLHPYSRALRTSRVESAERGLDLPVIVGEPPGIGFWPAGCRFSPRCELAEDICLADGQPPLHAQEGQMTACLRSDVMSEGAL